MSSTVPPPPAGMPPQQWQPQQPGPAAVQNNSLAVAGLVVAAIGAGLSLIPLIGIVAWLLCPVGIALSIAGVAGAGRRAGTGRTQGIVGIVLGVVGLFFCVIYLVVFAQMGTSHTSSSPAYSATPSVASDPAPEAASGYGKDDGTYGETLAAGDLQVTVSAPKTVSQPYLGDQQCSTVTYRNTGTTRESFNPFDWKFRTSAGVEASASIPFNAKNPLRSGQLAPGGTVSGQVCADDTITNASAVVYSPGLGIMHELTWQ